MPLTITTHRAADTTMLIQPDGALVSDDAAQLTDRVIAVLAATKPPEIVVDLEGVPHIDDAGVGALVSGYDRAIVQQSRLTVVGAQPAVHRQLRGRGLDGLLTAPNPPAEPELT